jgi:GntR family transcriptional regulator
MLSEASRRLYPNINKPLYLQLRDIIVDLIDSGEFSPGDTLPGERALAEMYDISRVTVRKCIASLVDEGYVERRQGKETTVAQKKVVHNLGPLLGIVEELLNNEGFKATVNVIHKGFEAPTSTVRKFLRLGDSNKSQVYAFSRVLEKNGKPLAINHSYVPYDIGKIVDSLDLSKDKVFAYLENCGYNLSYGEQEITSSLCTREESTYLKYDAGRPVLVIRRTTYLENGFPILYEKTIYRGDEYQYNIRLQRKI